MMTTATHHKERRIALAVFALTLAVSGIQAADNPIDDVMYQDPSIEFPEPIKVFSHRLKPLWLAALSRPEVDLQRQAAESFGLAHGRGMQDLEDVVAPLLEKVRSPETHIVVRLAAARTLVQFDARQAAPELFEFTKQGGLDAIQLVEPALAEWDFAPIRAVWLARLDQPLTPRQPLRLAIQGLAAVRETRAAPRLLELVKVEETAVEIRIEAARALAALETTELVKLAADLARDRSPQGMVNRLLAASLLDQRHHSVALLEQLAVDDEPAVAGIALRRLLQVDRQRIVRIAEKLLPSRDANVRRLTAEALVGAATISNIELLAPLLDDPHPQIRMYVRDALISLAEVEQFDARVRSVATRMLATPQWRGIEQATYVLVALDHKQAAERLVELLEFQRPEVFVAAAWGLRKLAVPATLSAMLDRTRRMAAKEYGPDPDIHAIDNQVAHLFQAFGQMRFTAAESLMRAYIPKNSHPLKGRMAAIWSLGHFHAGQPDAELTKLFADRIVDITHPADPESVEVCRMAAISLGRMKSTSALAVLRRFLAEMSVDSELGYACGWAIQQIAGEQMPAQQARVHFQLGWFLEPFEGSAANEN